MNIKIVGRMTGRILLLVGLLMLIPLIVAVLYREDCAVYLAVTAALTAGVGLALAFLKPGEKTLYAREGFAIVAFSWIGISLFGALPFFLSGEIPNYLDAVFETVSGFTTTGSSILNNVEAMSKGLLFWRSFTHWIGGMGVLVLIMAISSPGDNSMHIARAEIPGPTVEKFVPRMRNTAKLLYGIYLAMTLLEIVLLLLGGMNLFDSLTHAFGTAGTGGFSVRNASIAAYESPYLQWVITIFMMLFGVNFGVYYLLLLRNWRKALKSSELRWYIGIILAAVALITVNIRPLFENFHDTLRAAAFQVSSVITTTGYATADFALWPEFSKAILLFLMVCGACAGSTGGGIKVSRLILLGKAVRREVARMLHPRAVRALKFDGKVVEEGRVHSVIVFFTLYMGLCCLSFLVLSLDRFDLETNLSAVLACLNNIGPGLNLVGPMGNYSEFSALSKIVLCFDMLLGRLEIYPILLMLVPTAWKRRT